MKGLLRIALVVVVAAWALLGLAAPGHALVTYSDLGSWTAAATNGSAAVDISSISEFDYLLAGDSVALPLGGSLTFDINLQRLQVPDSWFTWSGGKEPAVFWTDFFGYEVTGTFAGGALGGFGLEMEPAEQAVFEMTLLLSDGSSLSQDVDGLGGAAFFGWIGEGVLSMTLSCPGCDFGFAFGEMVQAAAAPGPGPSPVPEPGTLLLLASGLAGMGLWGTRRRS